MARPFRRIPAAGMALILSAGLACADAPPADKACFWDFNGSLRDCSGGADDLLVPRDGRGRQATVRFVLACDVPGTSGKAAALGVQPSDAQYLIAPTSKDVRLGPSYTIEAWVHPTHLAVWNRLVLNWGGKSQYAYHLAIHNGRASLYHGQANGEYVFAEGGRVQAGRWQHVAGVARRDDANPARSTLTVYLDGRVVGVGRFDGTIRALTTEGLGVGDSAGAPSQACRYRGYIDAVTVWNRALTGEEIRSRHAVRAKALRDLYAKQDEALRRQEIARRADAAARLARLGVTEIVFAERHPGRDLSGHYYANFGYSCCDPTRWLHGADGGRLSRLNVRTGEVTVLLEDARGAVRDPQVHYDGERILFSYRRAGGHHYNLYEIRSDGTHLRQITRGPWDDIEPAYLPDGDIVFCSTRCKRYIGCWLAPSATLHRCNPSGGSIRMLSSGAFTENTPAVLPDGRVLYTRWEYVNRDAVSFHHLWTMNPDGTNPMVYFGNQRPGGVFIDAQPIPGTDRVVLIHSPGHGRNEHVGQVATAGVRAGPNARSEMRQVSRRGDMRDPYALSEDAFLVARGSQVLMMDGAGRTEVLHTGERMVHEPRPLMKRPRQRVIGRRTDLTETTATLVLADVYVGRSMAGVRRGSIHKLLVLEQLPKPANFHGGGSQPIGHGVTSTLKRILGTVPVEPDGSACFEVPPLRSLYVALLDAHDLSVKQMRSFVTLHPGETLGCVGCHERRALAPGGGHTPMALRRAPSRIEPIAGVPDIIDFPRDVQPVLDRHCLRCHNARDRKGGVVLSGDRGPVFSLSYYELLLHWQVKDTGGDPAHGSGRQLGTDRPYSTHSFASPVMWKIDRHHNKVRLSPRERDVIRLWIDTNTQYAGTYAAYGTGQVGGCWGNNRPVRVMADRWPSTPSAVDAVARRCGSCHRKQQMPYHVTALTATHHGDMLSWTRPLSRFSRHRLYDLTRPGKSLLLMAPLSARAGGYAGDLAEAQRPKPRPVTEDRRRPPKPVGHHVVFEDASDPDYLKILAHIQAAKRKLDEIKRFDMPGFRPSEHYVREMKRYGILPPSFDLGEDPIDVYATDRAYWRSFWHRPYTLVNSRWPAE